ncbi:hypothetical protein GGR57DRAFT_198865 [Xylariaceae sp. FL1272]|nr:hypothetical protein GGR57DRAFT_198865 [Xylariaceae sp. FL1272]
MQATAVVIAAVLVGAAQLSNAQGGAATSTLYVPIPTGGIAFTSIVPPCETVPAYAIIGVPNGTFFPGTTTVFLPPQASGATSTYFDTAGNLTEVVIAKPLPGTCADLELPADATATIEPDAASPSGSPNSTAGECPLQGCSAGIDEAAQTVIDVIDTVAFASQNLASLAKQIGSGSFSPFGARDDDNGKQLDTRAPGPFDLLPPLRGISATLVVKLPAIRAIPPFPPGCNSDTIVVALIDFVTIHQALLEILIGRKGIIAGPGLLAERDSDVDTDVHEHEARQFGFPNPVGVAIAGALRAIETGVDTLAFALIGIIPVHQECLSRQKTSIDATLNDAIAAYQA